MRIQHDVLRIRPGSCREPRAPLGERALEPQEQRRELRDRRPRRLSPALRRGCRAARAADAAGRGRDACTGLLQAPPHEELQPRPRGQATAAPKGGARVVAKARPVQPQRGLDHGRENILCVGHPSLGLGAQFAKGGLAGALPGQVKQHAAPRGPALDVACRQGAQGSDLRETAVDDQRGRPSATDGHQGLQIGLRRAQGHLVPLGRAGPEEEQHRRG
mmetsp:Transcript_143536/g.459037  ORF Transcript_143536/g.459037 Transcript_143536/m.459037 type:complete len:218 (-) Transcript_143536:161-814(-)